MSRGLVTEEERTLIRTERQGQCGGRQGGRVGSQLGSAGPPFCSSALTACQPSSIQASEFPLPLPVAGIIIPGKNNKGAACLKPCYKAVLRTPPPLPGLGRD